MNQPLVSVVMCTYNGSRFLDEQIDSILKQDYKNIELIIVDDNSTDDTWNKLNVRQTNHDSIRIYKNEFNLGYNKNFEKAISLANGDYIAIADQDDVWLPSKISKLVATFIHEDVVLAHNRSVRLEKGRFRFKSASLHHHFKGNDTRKLLIFNQVNGHDMLFTRKLVSKVLPMPNGMMYDWWIAVIATCYGKIASVDEYLVHHRIHADNSFFTNKTEVRKKEPEYVEVLEMFTTITAMDSGSKHFLTTFIQLISDHNKKEKSTFDYALFKFLFSNRKIIFGHKRRLFPEVAYLKYAIKYAKMDYRGKGISI